VPAPNKQPKPDLVIVAVPASASAPSDQAFHSSYTWILNFSLSFGHQEWDVVPILPSVAEVKPTPEQMKVESAALEVIQGQDIGWIERKPGDHKSADKILSRWLKAQAAAARTK